MRRVTAVIVMAALFGSAWVSVAAAEGPREGRFLSAGFAAKRAADVEIEVNCPPLGCSLGGLRVYVGTRRAKIVRPPKVECGEPNRRGVITCTVVRLAKALFTTCRPTLPPRSEVWNTRTTVIEWENSLLTRGSKAEAKDPPLERAYDFRTLPAGPQVLTARVPLRYGKVQNCLYLAGASQLGFETPRVLAMEELR